MADFKLEFEAIGTKWVIDGKLEPGKDKNQIFEKISDLIAKFDKDYSRFRRDSLIFKMSQQAGKYLLPPSGQKMIEMYQKLYKVTDGKFTPLIGQALIESGYDDSYSFKPKKLNKVKSWEEVIKYKLPEIEIKTPAILDFGGVGKGYLIDLISRLLLEEGIKKFCVDGGGDIYSKSDEVLQVGLEHPENSDQVIGIAKIKNQSICASSGNRRKWGIFHHIINPENLESPKDILATWVISGEAIIADSLATCLFLVKPEKLRKDFQFEYLVLFPDYTFSKSPDFPGELFLK